MGIPALFLAVLADRLIKGSGVYRTLLIWPYAVAPAVAGVLVAVHVQHPRWRGVMVSGPAWDMTGTMS